MEAVVSLLLTRYPSYGAVTQLNELEKPSEEPERKRKR